MRTNYCKNRMREIAPLIFTWSLPPHVGIMETTKDEIWLGTQPNHISRLAFYWFSSLENKGFYKAMTFSSGPFPSKGNCSPGITHSATWWVSAPQYLGSSSGPRERGLCKTLRGAHFFRFGHDVFPWQNMKRVQNSNTLHLFGSLAQSFSNVNVHTITWWSCGNADSISVGLGWGLRMCLSNKDLDAVDAAGMRPHPEEQDFPVWQAFSYIISLSP